MFCLPPPAQPRQRSLVPEMWPQDEHSSQTTRNGPRGESLVSGVRAHLGGNSDSSFSLHNLGRFFLSGYVETLERTNRVSRPQGELVKVQMCWDFLGVQFLPLAKHLDVPQSGESDFSKEWNYLLYDNYIACRADWLPNCSKEVSDHETALISPFVLDFHVHRCRWIKKN